MAHVDAPKWSLDGFSSYDHLSEQQPYVEGETHYFSIPSLLLFGNVTRNHKEKEKEEKKKKKEIFSR